MKNVFFTDTHAHIHMSPLASDTANVIKRAEEAGVKRIVTVGVDLENSKDALKTAKQYKNVYATVGVHPHDCQTYQDAHYKEYLSMACHEKTLAVGEIGLDFYRDISPRHVQEKVFSQMLELSLDAKKPVVIHNRDAGERSAAILDKHLGGGKSLGGIMHCFNGEKIIMDWALDNDFYLSFAGQITYKSAQIIQDALKYAPIERILIETDCPYLAPIPMRGKTNEPANLIYTADFVAYTLNVEMEDLAEILENNFARLYKRDPEEL